MCDRPGLPAASYAIGLLRNSYARENPLGIELPIAKYGHIDHNSILFIYTKKCRNTITGWRKRKASKLRLQIFLATVTQYISSR